MSDRLRELEQAASRGPWEAYHIPNSWFDVRNANTVGNLVHLKENAELCAALRNAAPLLLDVVDAARQMLLDCRLAGAEMEEEAVAWHSLKAKLDALDAVE